MKKSYLIIGGAAAAFGVWYFFLRKKEDGKEPKTTLEQLGYEPQTRDNSQGAANSAAAAQKQTSEKVYTEDEFEISYSKNEEEFNGLRAEYLMLTGNKAKTDWSLEMLRQRVEDARLLKSYFAEYQEIAQRSGLDNDFTDESKLDLADMLNALNLIKQSETALNKYKAAKQAYINEIGSTLNGANKDVFALYPWNEAKNDFNIAQINAEKEATKKFKKAQADYIAKVGNLYLADGKTPVTNYSGYQYNLNNIDTVVANYNTKATEVKTVKENQKKADDWAVTAKSIRQAVDAFWNHMEKEDWNYDKPTIDAIYNFIGDGPNATEKAKGFPKAVYAAQYFREKITANGGLGCKYCASRGGGVSGRVRAKHIADFKNGSSNKQFGALDNLHYMCDWYQKHIGSYLTQGGVDKYGVVLKV